MSSKMAFICAYPSVILSCILIFSSSPSLFSLATDTLTQGQSISDGQTLVSTGEVFELGFFSPGESNYRYVGIWYRNISTQSVVWVANREAPITNSSGKLTVGSDGNLQVLDGGGSIIWSSNLSMASNNTTVQLLDTGNLVIRSGSERMPLWKSFDHPTDTFLPGMSISLDRRSGRRLLFTSWKSPDDPSVGNYSLGLDPLGSAQIFVWEGTVPRWRSGQWNGQVFIGTTMRAFYIYGFKFENDVNEGIMYYTYTQFNSSLQRFVLQWDGVENSTMLVGETKDWETNWAEPTNEYEIYGKCGSYGKCSKGDSPMCSCLRGFDPNSAEEWSKGNWSGGCVRKIPLGCQLNSSGDGFFRLSGVKLPDRSDWVNVGSEAGCESACLNNCSCDAYAFVSGIGCMMWGQDLIDIHEFSEGGNDLLVKLAGSELGTNSKTWKKIVIASSLGVFFLITCVFVFLWWRCSTRIKEWLMKGTKGDDLKRSMRFNRDVRPDFSGPSKHGEEGQEGNGTELPLFNFESISAATGNFSISNKLGEGGFGPVYKGMLPGGQQIAVKRLSRSSGQGLEEFKNEVMLIAKLQHRNLVKLLGCCIQGEEKILIYEYMPNKSLDASLFDPAKQALLDWRKRFNIIEGIARGLVYLHRDSRLRIVHRDLKASNILLDEDMNPKISDFGMARIFGSDQNQANTNRVVGTFGYMSPEYAMEGLFSVKSDVYSFGILILEVVTGRRNSSFHRMEDSINIVGYAWQLWNENKAVELIDPSIRSSCPICQALRCIHIGLLCVQDRANDRPDMPSIVLMMGTQTATLPMPKQPTLTLEGSPKEANTLSSKHESYSASDVTITMLQGR